MSGTAVRDRSSELTGGAVPSEAPPHRYCDVCYDVQKDLRQCTGGCKREICSRCCNKPDAKQLCVVHGYPISCQPASRVVVGASLRLLDRKPARQARLRQGPVLRPRHAHVRGGQVCRAVRASARIYRRSGDSRCPIAAGIHQGPCLGPPPLCL